MKVEKIPLDLIKPYWRNPRVSKGAVDAVAKSIEKFGFNSPLILDKERVIIAGHMRYQALRRLGYTEADCVILELPEAKAKEYRIVDNKTSEFAGWDMMNLIPELRELAGSFDFGTFFPGADIDKLLMQNVFDGATTQQDIEKTGEFLQRRWEEKSQEVQEDYVQMICPHCLHEYFVSRTELDGVFKRMDEMKIKRLQDGN